MYFYPTPVDSKSIRSSTNIDLLFLIWILHSATKPSIIKNIHNRDQEKKAVRVEFWIPDSNISMSPNVLKLMGHDPASSAPFTHIDGYIEFRDKNAITNFRGGSRRSLVPTYQDIPILRFFRHAHILTLSYIYNRLKQSHTVLTQY